MYSLSITTKNISKSVIADGQTRTILSDVSLTVMPSSITALIGPSGAGKSTLLRCLNGLDTIDGGHIEIALHKDYYKRDGLGHAFKVVKECRVLSDNEREENSILLITKRGATSINAALEKSKNPTANHNDAKLKNIAMIFQAYTLLSRKTVLENVCLPITLRGAKLSDAHIYKAHALLVEVGLSDKANAYPSELSGGQRQRVAIARALMLDPGLLLCDELTSALDPKTTIEILNLLKRVNEDHGVTVILVTHDIDVVKAVADQVCVMDQGRIVEQGSVVDVLIKPKHSVTKQLLEATSGGVLPVFLLDRIQPKPTAESDIVLKLVFTDESSTKPVIAYVATQFNICFSILAGSLDNVSDQKSTHMYGHLWVSCAADDGIDAAIQYMSDHGVGVETVGYISWN
ncbi:MAG: ATP-binding cassette domain-containing protein [Candidatus Paracaedibacteraceae bacterium]|nr:ATP-binding cassette domain-containing protein [Candidatus Paracaedibacteraceae bacterium]